MRCSDIWNGPVRTIGFKSTRSPIRMEKLEPNDLVDIKCDGEQRLMLRYSMLMFLLTLLMFFT